MNDITLFCSNCKFMFNLNANSRYPMEGGYCITCVPQFIENPRNIDQMFITKLKKEILTPSCHDFSDAEEFYRPHAYSLDINTLKIYCEEHHPGQENCIILEINPARFVLKGLLRNALDTGLYPKEYNQDFKQKIYGECTVTEMHFSLCKKLMYDSNSPLCWVHLTPAIYLDSAKFHFQCELCKNDKSIVYADEDGINNLYTIALNICASAKTAAFNSTVLKLFHGTNQENNYLKNFFLEMRQVAEEFKSDLVKSSRCLLCEQQFSIGERHPIMLHDEERHEICYKCFVTRREFICPIDLTPYDMNRKPISDIKILFDISDRSCTMGHDSGKFSYKLHNFPYLINCGHQICEICYKNYLQTNAIICNCGRTCEVRAAHLDDYLLYKLKYLEMFCEVPDHREAPIKCFNDNDIIPYCNKCKSNPKYASKVTPELFSKNLYKKLWENANSIESELFIQGRSNYILLTMNKRYQLYKYMTNPCKNVMRFNVIYPSVQESLVNWYALGNEDIIFEIKSNTKFELWGLIIGKPRTKDVIITVKINGQMLFQGNNPKSNDFDDKIFEARFIKPYFVDREITCEVGLGKAGYFHGYVDVRSNERNSAMSANLDIDYWIKFNFNKATRRENNYGGPILGLIISSFTLPLE
ncbi:hypothetical protein SteCoe_37306 [Stentor coeruleus]|uniref:RING-type domain-containing protein n=1 Tax=Stentor coeruleus TaxID=5963 RepID=A0A1R2AN92_9CILI|nr:hypothetical protein SteCoe_37306 [Stentor coeruleus]